MSGLALADTSGLLALAEPKDQNHGRARAIAQRHLKAGGRFVASTAILVEWYTLVLARHGPERAAAAMNALLEDPAYEWVDTPLELVKAAVRNWLERYQDQEFSLTDAVSFEIMQTRSIGQAFAFDRHFVIAGFTLLS
ncbi:MAG: type II toxin-antitoxin system VapC family toxin [Gemmatimonadales bacterium]